MIVGLLFGSFNPVHYGHIEIASYFIKYGELNEVWFVISPQNPFKKHYTSFNNEFNSNFMLDIDQRLTLLKKSIKENNKFKICDIEISMPKPSYTYKTIKKLKSLFTDITFVLLMGSDQLADFKLWKNWEYILESISIYVYPRGNCETHQLLKNMKIFLDAPLINISSSEIRENMLKTNI